MATNKKGFGDLQLMLSGEVAPTTSEIVRMQKLFIPRITTAARDALSGADLYEGLVIYNITTHKLNVRVAAAWEVVTSA